MAILPPIPLLNMGIHCRHFGQHYIYVIFYSTTSNYTNSDTCILQWEKKFLQQSLVHKILTKNCHKESLITSRCRIFPSFYFPTNKFGIRNNKINQMNPNITLIFRTFQFGTKQLNHAYMP